MTDSQRRVGTPLTNLPSLTTLRIIAASVVFLGHVLVQQVFADRRLNEISFYLIRNAAPIGLSYFFVLSGFILMWSAKPTDSATRFWRRRFIRIYPNHVVVFLAIVALTLVAGGRFAGVEALASLVLVQAWWPDQTLWLAAVNVPTWSLSVEVLLYLCFPLLLGAVRRVREQRLWLWAGVFTGIALFMPSFVEHFFPYEQHGVTLAPPVQHWWLYSSPVARLWEFLVGMFMARILMSGRWIRISPTTSALLLFAVYLATLDIEILEGYQCVFLIPLALLVTGVAASDLDGRITWLNHRVGVWMGELTYAFYLIHVTLILGMYAAFSDQWWVSYLYSPGRFTAREGIAFVLSVYVICLALAAALYAGVERPMMRRWSRPRPAHPDPSSVESARSRAG